MLLVFDNTIERDEKEQHLFKGNIKFIREEVVCIQVIVYWQMILNIHLITNNALLIT